MSGGAMQHAISHHFAVTNEIRVLLTPPVHGRIVFVKQNPGRDMTQAAPALLSVEDVTLTYATPELMVTATYRVRFEVRAGDRFVLLGPSGCGKSSLLKAVGGYLQPTEGRITLKGNAIARPGPDRMMV